MKIVSGPRCLAARIKCRQIMFLQTTDMIICKCTAVDTSFHLISNVYDLTAAEPLTAVQDWVSTFVSVTLLYIFKKTLRHLQLC